MSKLRDRSEEIDEILGATFDDGERPGFGHVVRLNRWEWEDGKLDDLGTPEEWAALEAAHLARAEHGFEEIRAAAAPKRERERARREAREAKERARQERLEELARQRAEWAADALVRLEELVGQIEARRILREMKEAQRRCQDPQHERIETGDARGSYCLTCMKTSRGWCQDPTHRRDKRGRCADCKAAKQREKRAPNLVGRYRTNPDECKRGHDLTLPNAKIRNTCRECYNASRREAHAKKRAAA